MFNIGSGELALIAVVALLVLGPKRLPELARGIGKFMREFRRQTDEVRGVVEREFYKMDHEAPPPAIRPANDVVPVGGLPTPEVLPSQLTKGMPQGEPVVVPPAPVASSVEPLAPAAPSVAPLEDPQPKS